MNRTTLNALGHKPGALTPKARDVERAKLAGLGAQFSAEPVCDVNDHPRWLLTPYVEAAPGADILTARIADLQRTLA